MNKPIGKQFYHKKLVWTITNVHNKTYFKSVSVDDKDRKHTNFYTEQFISPRLIDYNNLPERTKLTFNNEIYTIEKRIENPKGEVYYWCRVENSGMTLPNYDLEVWAKDFESGLIMVYSMPYSIKLNIKVGSTKKSCQHKNRYKNIISVNIKFWVCKDCGKDLGDA